jgi:hypothetical protein
MKSLRIPAILASGILLLSALPQTDLQAKAAFADPKSTSMTISVDGTASDLTPTWIDSGVAKDAAFGGGDIGPRDDAVDGSANELTTMYTTKSSGDTSRALLRNMAQGGVEEITCEGGGATYYQRSQVTLGNLPTDAGKRVWAFYDGNVGSGSGIKEVPHFNHEIGGPDANTRIATTGALQKLCDGATLFVVKADDSAATPGTLDLGAARTTAGVYQDLADAVASVSFNVYVPMDAMDSTAPTIQLALGFVIDMTDGDSVDGSTLDDETADVAIETTIYAKPWWATPQSGSDPAHDEVHQILPACSSPAANDVACVIQADSGVFNTDGTTRLDAGATTGTSVVLTWLGDADSFEARLGLAPILPIATSGFSVPADKVSRISVSWPTDGTHYGAAFGSGADQVNFLLAIADTPVLVNPASSASDANKWSVTESSSRIITTLNGTTKSTSSGILRDTWWPQCNVGINEANAVTADKCGEDMTGSVTASEMVFSSVPATVNLMVSPNASSLAGGLVSTNGQGFAFGPETFAGTSFQFAVAGPSYTSADASRSTDGFYYVCVPATYLAGAFETNAADAAANWQGTRDGAAATTSFTTGTCGIGDTGLVASLAEFGYSAPLFRLLPVAVAAAPVAAPPVAPQPFMGPIPTGFSDRNPAIGDSVVVSGIRLSSVTLCTIDGIEAPISSVSATEFTIVVPAGVEPGLKNLVISSAYGRLFAQGAITVTEKVVPVAEPVVEPVVATGKVNAGSFLGYVAIYAKGHKGSTLSWKIAGKWFKTTITDEYKVYQRKTVAVGMDVNVDVFIDGVKQLSKVVATK